MRELSLHILDIVQNSLAAGANRICIRIREDTAGDRLVIEIEDNGCGMNDEQIKRALDPFYTTRKTRRVGLGLSLLQANAQACGGDLAISSTPGCGTVVRADFQLSHIDRVPLGDIVATLITLLSGWPDIHFIYERQRDEKRVAFDCAEIKKALGGIPFNHPEVLTWLQEYLQEKENEVY